MFGAFKYRTKNEPRQRAQLPFRQRMPVARGFMPLPAPMTRQPQGFGGGLGGLLRFLRPQIFRQPQRRGGLFGGLGSIFMPRRTPDFNPNIRRGGFLGGLGGLFGGRMGGLGGLFGRRFAEGGEVDAVPMQQGGDPFAANIVRTETGMDPITRQLLFGLDGKGGFIPGAFRAAEKTFFDEEGKARVVPEEVAGFSADQLRAQELARQAVGTQDPFLQQAFLVFYLYFQ